MPAITLAALGALASKGIAAAGGSKAVGNAATNAIKNITGNKKKKGTSVPNVTPFPMDKGYNPEILSLQSHLMSLNPDWNLRLKNGGAPNGMLGPVTRSILAEIGIGMPLTRDKYNQALAFPNKPKTQKTTMPGQTVMPRQTEMPGQKNIFLIVGGVLGAFFLFRTFKK